MRNPAGLTLGGGVAGLDVDTSCLQELGHETPASSAIEWPDLPLPVVALHGVH